MSFLFRKRKSFGAEQGRSGAVPTPAGIQSMDESLQRKFSKGVQFNIKILVRGDRNTGKTCLFQRMQGKPFVDSYSPTNEIQVASILWSYKVTNDTVKVEVWDIVDKGRSQQKATGGSLLKFFNSSTANENSPTEMALDAEFMDVYKGAHGVVFTYDITKQWTWKYVEKELERVPLHLPVIVLGNFRDMEEHRVVDRDVALYFIRGLQRPDGAAPIRYAECSMKNGFGLTHLHKFLSVPFLQLQQETLLQQLQVNREQTMAAKDELDGAKNSEDQNYEMFLEKVQKMSEARRRKSDAPSTPDGSHAPGGGDSPAMARSSSNSLERRAPKDSKPSNVYSGFGSKKKGDNEPESSGPVRTKAVSRTTIDEFVPEGGAVDDFLDSTDESESHDTEDESDESVDGNPQVTLDEDLSSPEEEPTPIPHPPLEPTQAPTPEIKKQPNPLKSAKDVLLTDSESEDGGPLVLEDEDLDEDDLSSKPNPKLPVSIDQLFESPSDTKSKKKRSKDVLKVTAKESEIIEQVKPTKKSSGLMLEFSPPPVTTATVAPVSVATESPPERRSSKHKKKSKKKKGTESTSVVEAPPTTSTQQSSNDPFGAIASLDAWLNSEPSGKDQLVWDSTSKTAEVGEEPGSGDERKPRKSKHKKPHKEDGERRKKHKHKSRHRTEDDL